MKRNVADDIERWRWLTAAGRPFSEAGCVTLAVGHEPPRVAQAFGLDLSTSHADGGTSLADQRAVLVSTAADPGTDGPSSPEVVCVLEANGFEGSRDVVLKAASRKGKAASIFWNVNGLVIFTCARRGRVLFSGELGVGDDLDELPRSLLAYARALDEDHAEDPVAVGAAMAERFVGVRPQGLAEADLVWHPLDPHVDELARLTADSSGLQGNESALLQALTAVPEDRRRSLVCLLSHRAVAQAGLLDDEAVAELLDSITPEGPGTYTVRLEARQRRWARESHRLWEQTQDSLNSFGVPEPLPEERRRVYQSGWGGHVLQYACHRDPLTALLGVAENALAVFAVEEAADRARGTFIALCRADPSSWEEVMSALPTAPSSAERDRQLAAQRDERDQQERAAEEQWEAQLLWGGVVPTARMRQAGGAASSLASQDRGALHLLADLDDDRLREVARWATRRVLDEAGLVDRPWVREHLAWDPPAPPTGPEERSRLFRALFASLDADVSVRRTTCLNEDGDLVSVQHMALPAVLSVYDGDALAAACNAVRAGMAAFGERAPEFIDEVAAQVARL